VSRFETDEPAAPVGIPARVLNELGAHAREAEPEECCGLVLSDGNQQYGRAVRCQNEMTLRHREDPEEFPRDGRAAYYMSMRDVLEISREADRIGERVTAVYHSHVGAAAYLSKDDLAYARNAAFPFPRADQIVLSVFDRSVREIKVFVRTGGDFSERVVEAT
jgi:adenylyltransferase/sulfurtransferase